MNNKPPSARELKRQISRLNGLIKKEKERLRLLKVVEKLSVEYGDLKVTSHH